MPELALEQRLTTAHFSYPFAAGWLPTDGVELSPLLRPDAAGAADLALLDTVFALTMLDTHVVLRDAAIVWHTASMLTLHTSTRPDELDDVAVAIGGVSATGRAVATATLPPFYGMQVADWPDAVPQFDAEHASISEDAAALQPVDDEDHYQEDLGRAWFLMSDLPYVSHVAVAPRELVAREPARVKAALARLLGARDIGQERGRELRRDLSKDLNIDRDTLVETLAAQTHELDDDALMGLADLVRRSGLGVRPEQLRKAVVWLGR